MQSQQSSISNHGRYNKSIRADHAVTRIKPVLSASKHKNQSKHEDTFSSNERGDWGYLLFFRLSPALRL